MADDEKNEAKYERVRSLPLRDLELRAGASGESEDRFAHDAEPPEMPDEPGRYADPGFVPRSVEFDPDSVAAGCASLPLNDYGNSQRFAKHYGEDLISVGRVGWFVWDGRRWKLDRDARKVRLLAQQVQFRIMEEIWHVELEDWQLHELAQEPLIRAELDSAQSADETDRTTADTQRLEELNLRLGSIKKLKAKRSALRGERRTFAKSTGNTTRISALINEADPFLGHEVEELDTDALCVNCESGLLRFSVTGGIMDEGFSKVADFRQEPHVRSPRAGMEDDVQYITKMVRARYDPDAACPIFDRFIARVQPDKDIRDFLQRWFGLCLTGLTGEQKFAFLFGAGANGKSVLVDVIARVMADYSATAKIESLTGKNRRSGGDATPDLIPLVGARMVRASEPEEGERLQEAMIKQLTGGEPIMVRQLQEDFLEIEPVFKLTISGNHKPEIRGTDDGIWRRVLLVPFDIQIPESERDDKMKERLWLERDGIFSWMVDGLLAYLEGGLQVPERIADATSSYRADSDPIRTFLQEACVITGQNEDFEAARDLMDGFNLWMDKRGLGMWGERTVSLKIKGFSERYRDPESGCAFHAARRGTTGYRGIKFQDFFRKEFDEAPRNPKGHPVAGIRVERSYDTDPGGRDF